MPNPFNPGNIQFDTGITYEPDPVSDNGSSGPTYEPE
jgi:hypothetical protein